MAEAATAEKPVDVSEPALTHDTQADSQNVDLSSAQVNGPLDEIENKQIAEIVDELVNSAEVSVSGGSDTEASKADLLKALDEKGHVRTSSTVRKPQSFKPVSVNKSFLGTKGAASTITRPDSAGASSPASTPSSTVAPSASRLKLVAKTGTLTGANKSLGPNGKPAVAPSASTVWNKNRPVPTPEPKKLSDEELVSQYGIHMADRLRPEDAHGQSNWADIDDDEEWAPDTITWGDGTKITLPQVDETTHSPAIAPAGLDKPPPPSEKPRSPTPSAKSSASPSVKPEVMASRKGLILKGAPEKPTLVAKPPAPPTPVKSPWATLPPIEKSSPVLAEAQPQQQPMRYGKDAAVLGGQAPAKEIAADDFSRTSWRDGHSNPNRELFNSQSGRYEPVQDRRSSRPDVHSRQPALLQRPHHEMQGPAEPSSAFQTSRSSGQEGPYGRRRGSSNVSGGSGSFAAARMGRPHEVPEMLEGRRNSVTAETDSPGSPRTFSPANSHPTPRTHAAQPYQVRPSPGQTYATPQQNPAGPEVASAAVKPVSLEDDLELQKKLMRERRELAIKRRLEEEAREEAARKERIQAKLAAMGPAPERKSAKKDEPAAPKIQRRDSVPAALATKTASTSEETSADAAAQEAGAASPLGTRAEPHVNGAPRSFSQSEQHPSVGSARPSAVPDVQSAVPWPESQSTSERFATWGGAPQNLSRNVWGAPGNDRSLGNGTFNSDIASLADSQPTQRAPVTSRPTPIGPPRVTSQNPAPRQEQPAGRLPPIGPPGRTVSANLPPPASRRAQSINPWQNVDIAAQDRALRQTRMAERAVSDAAQAATGSEEDDVRFHDDYIPARIGKDGRRETERDVDEPARPASYAGARFGNEGRQTSDYPPHHGPNGVSAEYGRPHAVPTGTGPSSQSRGGSRFFPSRDIRNEESAAQLQARTRSPTPPPPTMGDHPAYDGDAMHPHVALPPTRPVVKLPPPAVRLPSSQGMPPPKQAAPVSFAAAAAAVPSRLGPQPPAGAARPLSRGLQAMPQTPHEVSTQENWQAKINDLIGRKARSPTKVMAVDSLSVPVYDHAHQHTSATVSLPSLSPSSSLSSDDSIFISKEMAEECFGEQEMGSLPPIHLPTKTPDALWHPFEPNWNPLVAKFRVESTAMDMPRFPFEIADNKTVIRVQVPGMLESKTVLAPYRRQHSNSRRQGPRGGRHVSRGGTRGGREGSSGFSGEREGASSERPSSSRGGRGAFRGRNSDNWSRHTPSASAVQT